MDDASSPRYGAVRAEGSGPAWAMIQGISSSGHQKRFDGLRAKGFLPARLDVEEGYDTAVWVKG
ncbi:hypothetical protein [Streptosporangium roseum]|uniref:hypothetical protein n=1 Tax=Streptosporangium roseum TaxID=2001 RepID=UPI00332F7DA4